MIRYVVDVGATNRHSFSVELRIERPDSEQRLSLPAWIPGSYLVREFARHLSGLAAEQGGSALPLQQLDKATWLVRCGAGAPGAASPGARRGRSRRGATSAVLDRCSRPPRPSSRALSMNR